MFFRRKFSYLEARHGNPSNSPIRIREIQTIHSVVYIRCLIIGGPYDVYYMVRPESTERGDPDDRTIMRYGERVSRLLIISFPFFLYCDVLVFYIS